MTSLVSPLLRVPTNYVYIRDCAAVGSLSPTGMHIPLLHIDREFLVQFQISSSASDGSVNPSVLGPLQKSQRSTTSYTSIILPSPLHRRIAQIQ
jgi:hypothetical protein